MKRFFRGHSQRNFALISILVLASLVRLCGVSFNLPYVYHTDEARFAEITLNYFTGDLNPHFFHAPTLYTYAVAGLWGGYYLAGKSLGKFANLDEFRAFYPKQPKIYIILGRLLTIVLSIATIYLIFLIGERMFGFRAGWMAALLLIFSPEHNKISHYLVPDSPMVFFLVLAFFFIWRIYKNGKTEDYLFAGLFAGLAFATKYGGHLLFLPLFLAHLFRQLENKKSLAKIFFSPPLILSGAFFVLAFFVGCPYAFLDFKKFYADFKWQSEHLVSVGHFGSSTAQPAWLFYLQWGFRENAGLLSQFLVLGGFIYSLAKADKKKIILFSYPLLLFILIGTWKTRAVRYMLPIAPFLALIAGLFLDFILDKISFLSRKKLLTGLMVVLFLLPSGLKVFRFNYTLTQEDTRTIAKNWINTNIPKKTRIANEHDGPPISGKNYRITYRHSLSQVDLDWLARRKIRYVVTNDIMYARFTRFPLEFPKEAAFYNSLDEKAFLVKTFRPRWDEYLLDLHNPTIKIYRLSQYPNYSFPGNFRHYSQEIILTQSENGTWTLRANLTGEGQVEGDEKVKNPYVKVISAEGKEVAKIIIHEGEINSVTAKFFFSSSAILPHLPAGSKIIIGYQFEFSPESFKFEMEGQLKKEHEFKGKIDDQALLKKELKFIFLYSALPDTRGEDYFQTVELSKTHTAWDFSSAVFGGELRWGDDYVLNPFALVTDEEGKELKKLLIFNGPIGSVEAKRKAPVKKAAVLPSLPENYRVFIGYEFYYDGQRPELAGGPFCFEMKNPAISR